MKRNMRAGKGRSGGLEFKVFNDDEMDDIHLATLEILEKTGLEPACQSCFAFMAPVVKYKKRRYE